MWDSIKINILYPAVGRLGTVLIATVVGWGVSAQHADWLSIGLLGIGGAAFDLGVGFLRKRLVIKTAISETLDVVLNGKPFK